MKELNDISKTLFLPVYGRALASSKFPEIFQDKKAEEILHKIPENCKPKENLEYSILASATRSLEMDKLVKEFIKYHRDGVIVEVGGGLATMYYRHEIVVDSWYLLDLDDVIELRKEVFGKEPITLIKANMFDSDWMDEIKNANLNKPILFICGGLFHYFSEVQVISFLSNLKSKFRESYILFDTLSKKGIKKVDKYMKQMGHENIDLYFYVDNAKDVVNKLGEGSEVLLEKPMYQDIDKKGLKFTTKVALNFADNFKMVKLVYLKLQDK